MYAVVGVWRRDVSQSEEQLSVLREQIVPNVSQSPGFVSGYWTHDRSGGRDYTMIVFEREEAALDFKGVVEGNSQNQAEHGIKLESLAVAEVLAEAHAGA
ncbi:MAG: hypothetical protein M3P51_18180 [Chloroflexota bacterium]|nr:hypothetical protein [Chloroflexota bacterium]